MTAYVQRVHMVWLSHEHGPNHAIAFRQNCYATGIDRNNIARTFPEKPTTTKKHSHKHAKWARHPEMTDIYVPPQTARVYSSCVQTGEQRREECAPPLGNSSNVEHANTLSSEIDRDQLNYPVFPYGF